MPPQLRPPINRPTSIIGRSSRTNTAAFVIFSLNRRDTYHISRPESHAHYIMTGHLYPQPTTLHMGSAQRHPAVHYQCLSSSVVINTPSPAIQRMRHRISMRATAHPHPLTPDLVLVSLQIPAFRNSDNHRRSTSCPGQDRSTASMLRFSAVVTLKSYLALTPICRAT